MIIADPCASETVYAAALNCSVCSASLSRIVTLAWTGAASAAEALGAGAHTDPSQRTRKKRRRPCTPGRLVMGMLTVLAVSLARNVTDPGAPTVAAAV